MDAGRQVFDQTEAANFLGATRNTVRKALLAGDLPARRIGRRWFIGKAALEAWLAAGGPVTAGAGHVPAGSGRQR